jgi:hypothetical protein
MLKFVPAAVFCKSLKTLVRRSCAGVFAVVAVVARNLLILLMRWFCGGLRWCVPHTPLRLRRLGKRRVGVMKGEEVGLLPTAEEFLMGGQPPRITSLKNPPSPIVKCFHVRTRTPRERVPPGVSG